MSSSGLSLEKLASATIRNRAEYCQLQTELNRIEKEKCNEIKMLNTEKQRFRAKYSKTDFNSEAQEASDVKMYETHNPGFCFKRNGEHRNLQNVPITPSFDFEHLRVLLFTNGEVDIEKLLCLHLLSSHEIQHLTPPKKTRISNTFMKRDSPLEQLIERSKDSQIDIKSSMILPTYVLDVNKENIESNLINDERLTERLLVNEKILKLISTVIITLEETNPEKIQDLVNIAEDPANLKRIFHKSHIQEFVMSLKDHALVNSCSSFVLTQPSKNRPNQLQIRTSTGALEDLVNFIRSNVLQFPNRNNWTPDEIEETIRIVHSITSGEAPTVSKKNQSKSSVKTEPKKEVSKRTLDDITRFRRCPVNFVAKNIEAAATYRKSTEEEIDCPKLKRSSKSSTSKRSSLDSRSNTEKNQTKQQQSVLTTSKRKSSDNDPVKVHLKQTTCPACMEKWKEPLPTPKVSKVVRNNENLSSNEESFNTSLKTNSIQRISMLIEREQYKLNSYDTKYANASATPLVQPKKKVSQQNSVDFVSLDAYDLEKIKQEIREKETKKKLEKFLCD